MRERLTMIKVEGLSLEKLLARASDAGVKLYSVKRTEPKSVCLEVDAKGESTMRALCDRYGYRMDVLRVSAKGRAWRLFRQRALLCVGLAVFLMGIWGANLFVWQVEVEGAGESIGEVRLILEEQQVKPGRLKASLSTQALKEIIEARLPRVKYVDVYMQGVQLTIECAGASMAVPAEYGGENGDVVATKEGIITGLYVIAGTPAVQIGDAVRAGQVLVYGQERSADESVRAVPARAQALAQTYYSGKAKIGLSQTLSIPTGREFVRTLIETPFFEYTLKDEPEFDAMDVAYTYMPVGGGLLPVTLKTQRFIEITTSKSTRDEQEVRAECARAAEEIARRNVPIGVEVVDKWLDYSMIEEGIFAQVILTCEEDIALQNSSE